MTAQNNHVIVKKKKNFFKWIPPLLPGNKYNLNNIMYHICGGAGGVIVIVVGNEHGDTSSNPGRNSLHFT